MKITKLLLKVIIIVYSCFYNTKTFGQVLNVTINSPQTISTSSASLTSTSSSNSGIASAKWTKFSVPGQTLKKVIVVGSSTAAGNGTTSGANAFVNKLRAYYQSQGIINDIINLAVSGTTPFDININSVLDLGTDILLVSYPSNGYTASNNGNVMNKYQEMQNACNSRNVQMFVTGTQPRNDFNDADRANLITMNNLLRNAFTDRFIDFLTPLLNTNGNVIKSEYYADGIHPNDAGHEVLYQLVREANIFRNSISSSSNIANPTSANTNITGVTQGVHRFQIGVLDNGGFAASAVATITVNGGGSQGPAANAGQPQTILLPTNQVTLSGSGSAGNGGTVIFGWTQVSGPNLPPPIIVSPNSASTNVLGLVQGSYIFRLTVTQNDNQTASSDVTVNVNTVGGQAKTIPGKIEAENWDGKSGPQYTMPTSDAGGGQQVVGITNGSWMDYNITVTQPGTYTVNFRVATTQLHAQFQIKSGNTVLATINIPNTGEWNNWATVGVNNVLLTAGNQILRILSTNNENCNLNWIEFVLAGGGNQPPTADAGPPQNITLPVSQVTLTGTGTAANGETITFGWTQVSGPNLPPPIIVSPNSASTIVTGLVQGAYVFHLTVIQNDNQTATSDVTITVNPVVISNGKTIPGKIEAENWDAKSGSQYTMPTSDAGGGQQVVGITNGSWMDYNINVTQPGTYTVNFRVATTQLHAQFQIKSGNTVLATINIPNTGEWNNWVTIPVTNVSLTAGNQILRILSTNNENCNLNWIEFVLAGGGNQPPTANTGSPQNITLPVSQVTLTGTGTAGNGGTVTYAWTNLYGPNQPPPIIVSPNSAGTIVTGLIQGTYVFRLTVTQDDNQTATSDITITVNQAVSQTPIANAGPPQTITLPANQVTLSGSGTTNNGGSIISHTWTKSSGASATITDPSNYGTAVADLSAGIYVFRLTVMQNDNQTAISDVTITVNPAPDGKTIPGKIEAEAWDTKSGYEYAVPTTDAGGGLKMVGINNGSWMDYNVNVTQSGTYTVNFRVATAKNSVQFRIKSGNIVLAIINIPNTGEWNNWATIPVTNVSLTAGAQTIRILSANSENCDFNWMDWVLAETVNNMVISNRTLVQKANGGKTFTNSSLEIFQNPVADQFALKVSNDQEGSMKVQIFDQDGRLRKQTLLFKNKGISQSYISAADLPKGMYILRLQIEGWSSSVKMIKL